MQRILRALDFPSLPTQMNEERQHCPVAAATRRSEQACVRWPPSSLPGRQRGVSAMTVTSLQRSWTIGALRSRLRTSHRMSPHASGQVRTAARAIT